MNSRKSHLDALAVTLLLLCCLTWGLQQVLAKATIAEIAPVFQVSLRLAAASVVLALWCRWRGIPLFVRDGTLWPGLLAGALFAAEFGTMYLGLQYTTASRLTVFLYTSPFWVAALVPLWVHAERMSLRQWVGLVCAFLAVAFALREGLMHGQSGQWRGDLLGLAAGMFWGLTTVVMRSTGLIRISPERLLFYQVAFSAVVLPFVSLLLGEPWVWHFSAFGWSSLAAQTFIGAFASYLTWMWLLGRYPATQLSSFVFLTPVFALLFGNLWLGEAVSLSLLAALALVGAGIVLVNRR